MWTDAKLLLFITQGVKNEIAFFARVGTTNVGRGLIEALIRLNML